MVEIGGKPMIWHIMSIYAAHGFNEFFVACGYKGEYIKEYFRNAYIHSADFIIDLKDGAVSVMNGSPIDWKIGLIDTGLDTMTGGRIRRLEPWLKGETFMATYGDGLGSVDIRALMDFHRSHGKLATVTAVRPPARFGGLVLEEGRNAVGTFSEKPQTGEGWINGGFFVFEPGVLDYLTDTSTLEREPLEGLAGDGHLHAYRHTGFWECMDTYKDAVQLNDLWEEGQAPWKLW
jgi:glucose-1-phosphate cytidylyltransferase